MGSLAADVHACPVMVPTNVLRRSAPPRPRRSLFARVLLALAAVGLFLFGYQWGNQLRFGGDTPPGIGGVLVLPPQPLPAVPLRSSADGRPVQVAGGDWTLLAVASPATAAGQLGVGRMVEVANRLAGETLQGRLRLWLLSADDAPALAQDFQRLTPMLAILTGEPADLDRLRGALGFSDAGGAGTDGPPALYLIDPDARLVALFPDGQPPATIAADVLALSRWTGWARLVTTTPPADAEQPPD